jgi:hypothetical protein
LLDPKELKLWPMTGGMPSILQRLTTAETAIRADLATSIAANTITIDDRSEAAGAISMGAGSEISLTQNCSFVFV